MSISPQRLTLFTLLDAIERDLRAVIRLFLMPNLNLENLLTEHEMQKAIRRLGKDESIDPRDYSDDLLIGYLDLADEISIINRNRRLLAKDLSTYFKKRTLLLEKIVPISKQGDAWAPIGIR